MKVTLKMLAPQLRFSGAVCRIFLGRYTPGLMRLLGLLSRPIRPLPPPGVRVAREYLTREDGSRMRMLMLTPKKRSGGDKPLPAVMWLHGGGYSMGNPEFELAFVARLMKTSPCAVLLPDYTLSGDKPYPAAAEDCYSALLWLRDNASRFGARSDRLIVGGDSAGGGLVCAVTLMARDRKQPDVAFQIPIYPMLDDRMNTPSMRQNNAPIWNERSNRIAWRLYLGELFGSDDVPPYAAPARAESLEGLPPAYSFVGTIEPFYDETREYFSRLRAAGIPAVLDECPGCYHAFDRVSRSSVSKQAVSRLCEQFRELCERL